MRWNTKGSQNVNSSIARKALVCNTFCHTIQRTPEKEFAVCCSKGQWKWAESGSSGRAFQSLQVSLLAEETRWFSLPMAPTPPENTEKLNSKAQPVLLLPLTNAIYSNLHGLGLNPTFFLGSINSNKGQHRLHKKGEITIKRASGGKKDCHMEVKNEGFMFHTGQGGTANQPAYCQPNAIVLSMSMPQHLYISP